MQPGQQKRKKNKGKRTKEKNKKKKNTNTLQVKEPLYLYSNKLMFFSRLWKFQKKHLQKFGQIEDEPKFPKYKCSFFSVYFNRSFLYIYYELSQDFLYHGVFCSSPMNVCRLVC